MKKRKQQPAPSPWIQEGMAPCDPEIFRKAMQVWESGVKFPLRKRPVQGPGYFLSDIPINRGAMATIGFLRARRVEHPQGYLIRLMHFYEVIEHASPGGVLAKFMKPGDEAGAMMISEALIDAVALAPVRQPAKETEPATMLDIGAIDLIAQRLWDADETSEVSA